MTQRQRGGVEVDGAGRESVRRWHDGVEVADREGDDAGRWGGGRRRGRWCKTAGRWPVQRETVRDDGEGDNMGRLGSKVASTEGDGVGTTTETQ
jgi:hypothetical protein